MSGKWPSITTFLANKPKFVNKQVSSFYFGHEKLCLSKMTLALNLLAIPLARYPSRRIRYNTDVVARILRMTDIRD